MSYIYIYIYCYRRISSTIGAETWTITQTMKKQLDGCYIRMLRMVP